MLIFVAKILWSTTHAPQNAYMGAPQKRFSLLVGNGEKINIWCDPWIPSSPDRKVISPRGGAVFTRVSELIEPITGQWDMSLLHSLFGEVDVHRILQIPLHRQGFDDFNAWDATSHGRYTIRSALDTTYNGAISLVHQLLNSHFQGSRL
jgi:hypothetical protein